MDEYSGIDDGYEDVEILDHLGFGDAAVGGDGALFQEGETNYSGGGEAVVCYLMVVREGVGDACSKLTFQSSVVPEYANVSFSRTDSMTRVNILAAMETSSGPGSFTRGCSWRCKRK
jgi:hypothetical protein